MKPSLWDCINKERLILSAMIVFPFNYFIIEYVDMPIVLEFITFVSAGAIAGIWMFKFPLDGD